MMLRPAKLQHFAPVLALCCLVSRCLGQGTMIFTFEGLPPGTLQQVGVYTEKGVQFGPHGVGNVFLSGGGIAGYPDDGTGYLQIPDGYLSFNYPITLPSTFRLVSFDAAELLDGAGPQTVTVVGYQPMNRTVTQSFTVNNLTFQTFYLNPSFVGLFEVDVYNARWSLDNFVISGVPEPSVGALALLGAACAFWFGRLRWRHHA